MVKLVGLVGGEAGVGGGEGVAAGLVDGEAGEGGDAGDGGDGRGAGEGGAAARFAEREGDVAGVGGDDVAELVEDSTLTVPSDAGAACASEGWAAICELGGGGGGDGEAGGCGRW